MNDAVVFGPTYEEMLDPRRLPPDLRRRVREAAAEEFSPLQLYRITWRSSAGNIRKVVLPKQLTGVKANILVLIGKDFPSGSHKVGPAYTTLAEGELKGEISPGQKMILAPSTGNFGIGSAYISKLKGYRCTVVMPDSMSKERYERIRRYGGDLELTPGTESDVILTLEKTYELKKKPDTYTLAQFELLPNYRFHRFVTGRSCLEAAKGIGNGKIACFVSAPGSAGTIGAGDEIKSVFPKCVVAAAEPRECSTLYDGGVGQHRIEGIGDKMVTLIHNLLTTDYVVLVHDDDCVAGLYVIQRGARVLTEKLGVPAKSVKALANLFGVSSICNILASIKMAKRLDLGPRDNVVTIATDGFDRYPSVLQDLEKRRGRLGDGKVDDRILKRWAYDAFIRIHGDDEVLDVRSRKQKERLFGMKERMWTRFGYSRGYLDSMKKQDFWEKEYARIREIDRELAAARKNRFPAGAATGPAVPAAAAGISAHA